MNSFEEAKKHIETCNMCGGKMTYHRTIKNKYSGMLDVMNGIVVKCRHCGHLKFRSYEELEKTQARGG